MTDDETEQLILDLATRIAAQEWLVKMLLAIVGEQHGKAIDANLRLNRLQLLQVERDGGNGRAVLEVIRMMEEAKVMTAAALPPVQGVSG